MQKYLLTAMMLAPALIVGCGGENKESAFVGTWHGAFIATKQGKPPSNPPKLTLNLKGDHKFELVTSVKTTGTWSEIDGSVELKLKEQAGKPVSEGAIGQNVKLSLSTDSLILYSSQQPITWRKA